MEEHQVTSIQQAQDEMVETFERIMASTRLPMEEFTRVLQELKASVEELGAIKKEKEKEELTAHRDNANNFTDWKGFLDMQPERLQPLTAFRYQHPAASDSLVLERVPEPTNAHAKMYTPKTIYQAGTNEWYVESGKYADSKGGSGYLVTRQYIPERSEFRWFCACVAAKRAMYSENPHCKHMYAVQEFITDSSPNIMQWALFATMIDMAMWLVQREKFLGFTEAEHDTVEDLKETFPQLENYLAYVETVM